MRTILIALTASTLVASATLLGGCGDESAKDPANGKSTTSAGPDGTSAAPSAIKSPADWPTAAERRFAPDREPSPYSPLQIAQGCGPQSKRVFRIVMSGQETSYKLWTFREQTEEGCAFLQTDCDQHGVEMGEPKVTRFTWKQLQSHAAWPAADTTASEDRLEIPAGAYECMHYVVARKAADKVGEDKYWFAWDLPGPPIRLERRVNGELKLTMTLMKVEGVAAR